VLLVGGSAQARHNGSASRLNGADTDPAPGRARPVLFKGRL
jgi:hypothetical protein